MRYTNTVKKKIITDRYLWNEIERTRKATESVGHAETKKIGLGHERRSPRSQVTTRELVTTL